MPAPVVAEIGIDAIRRNLAAIRRRVGSGTPICAAAKAEAYGHGLAQVLPALAEARVERLAVANLTEALHLRALGWPKPILCFGPVLATVSGRDQVAYALEAVAAEVACTITSGTEARILDAAGARLGRSAHVEVQIDSGMGRFGIAWDGAARVVAEVARYPHVALDGVYMHFATADETDLSFAREQLRRFLSVTEQIKSLGVAVGAFHAANSAAVFRLPESHLYMVRPGLAVYGYWGGPAGERPRDLWPAMRVVSHLEAVRRLPAGHAIGYGCTYTTQRESLIGTVPVGYADGYRRLLSNDAVLTLPERDGRSQCAVPVVGRVSMDQVNVDLTDAGDVRVGERIVIIDSDPAAPNSVETLARKMNTIPYEITCLLGQRIQRTAVP